VGAAGASISNLHHHNRRSRRRASDECVDHREAIGKAAQRTDEKSVELWEGALSIVLFPATKDRNCMTLPRQQNAAPLLFTCPTTGRAVPTGIATDAESLRKAWKMELKIECPHCGAPHEISVRKFFIEGAVRRAAELN
jgi:hypothetical protein